jgi:hypothetical protein
MRPKLSENTLFVFSDPGGAKPCLSLIEIDTLSNANVISDRHYSFYENFTSSVNVLAEGFDEYIEEIHPDMIFTGTSYTSDIEQRFIQIARDNGILCYSFVDHWTNVSKRFRTIEGEMILPDAIWVIDENAKQIAINEGIDEGKIIISGNPYHQWLRMWKPKLSKYEFLSKLGIDPTVSRSILYAPDPLSNVNGKDRYGFDEYSALEEFINVFNKFNDLLDDHYILIKAHPNQQLEKLGRIVAKESKVIILPQDIDEKEAMVASEFVIGHFSSILIEAELLGVKVFRYLPESTGEDPLKSLNVGEIVNTKSLGASMINSLK